MSHKTPQNDPKLPDDRRDLESLIFPERYYIPLGKAYPSDPHVDERAS